VEILSIIHGGEVRAGVFAEPVRRRGHLLTEWSAPSGFPPPRPIEEYDAAFVFGGSMHADQEDEHVWLRDEDALIRRLLELETPLLGVCLGGQLLAKAADAWIGPASEPEIGWFPLELTDAAADDSLFAMLPRTFDAFQWHFYAFDVPDGAVELARNDVCSQAFRLGERAWGVQFHPEVTLAQVEGWIDDPDDPCPDPEGLRWETRRRIDEWNDLGRRIADAFVEVAERRRSRLSAQRADGAGPGEPGDSPDRWDGARAAG
jgi:GMP synthase-like glutamine amidotransferase